MNILEQLEGSHRMMLACECGGSVSRTLTHELVIGDGVWSSWFIVTWSYGSCKTQSLAEACRVYESYAKAEAA